MKRGVLFVVLLSYCIAVQYVSTRHFVDEHNHVWLVLDREHLDGKLAVCRAEG